MVAFTLTGFASASPRTAKNLLQDNEAQRAINTKLASGELRSWMLPNDPEVPVTFSSSPMTIFGAMKSDGSTTWMNWTTDVDVVRGPVNDNSEYRLYYTGDGYPKKTNTALAEAAGSGEYPRKYLSLGVPAPVAAPNVTVTGGSGGAESRVYVYTYVSEFGTVQEESAPSVASAIVSVLPGSEVIVDGFSWPATYSQSDTTITVSETAHGLSNGMEVYLDISSGTADSGWYTVTVTDVDTYTVTADTSASTSGAATVLVKAPNGKYNITKRRIYRSVTGSAVTSYLFVTELPIATTSFRDDVDAAGLGELLPSDNWDTPPADLKGLVLMPNGFGAAFRKNEVYFSEPYQPHAWPADYVLTFDYDVVGLGVVGSTLIVLTTGYPYSVQGTDPSVMSSERIPLMEPCISKRSIASDEYGVMYVSPNGAVNINQASAQVASRNILTKEQWQAYKPNLMHGKILDGRYYLFYDDGDVNFGGVILDRYTPNAPFSVTNVRCNATYVSPTETRLYMAMIDKLKIWDNNPAFMLPYEWKSKLFVTQRPVNIGVLQADGDLDVIGQENSFAALVQRVIDDNQTIWLASSNDLHGVMDSVPLNNLDLNGSLMQNIPKNYNSEYVQVQIWANEELRYTAIILDKNPVRLPSGYKADRWEFLVSGNIPLRTIKFAETMEQLKQF